MPQSFAALHVHLVFSTKCREPLLLDTVRDDLHSYFGGVLRDLDSPPLEINTQPDHAHLLFGLSRTHALCDVVGQLKRASSAWLKTKGADYRGFAWQTGYGAFSVSLSAVDQVRAYIQTQAERHRTMTFQYEYRVFLKRHGMTIDERHIWE